jgi:uncharacterized protein (TIGR02145 family)
MDKYFLSVYALLLIFIVPSCKKKEDNTIRDGDGNEYTSVTIGTQTWIVENLMTTTFNDHAPIPYVSDSTQWRNLVSPGYCWYNNNISNKEIYGALYNWYTVNTGKLCPVGWHVPDDQEWLILTDYLGGLSVAGGMLKEMGNTHWSTPNADATNETGFTALPGGFRGNSDFVLGIFNGLGNSGYWWSSTENGTSFAWDRGIYYDSGSIYEYGFENKKFGDSVRCIKD